MKWVGLGSLVWLAIGGFVVYQVFFSWRPDYDGYDECYETWVGPIDRQIEDARGFEVVLSELPPDRVLSVGEVNRMADRMGFDLPRIPGDATRTPDAFAGYIDTEMVPYLYEIGGEQTESCHRTYLEKNS